MRALLCLSISHFTMALNGSPYWLCHHIALIAIPCASPITSDQPPLYLTDFIFNVYGFNQFLYVSDSFYSKFAGHLSGTDFQSDRILPKLYSTWLVKWKNLLRTSDLQSAAHYNVGKTLITVILAWQVSRKEIPGIDPYNFGFFLGFGSYAWDWPQKQSQNILFSLEE